VSGAVANLPRNGGDAWTRLSWILGLRRLGFSVYFLEQIGQKTCVDACGTGIDFESCANRAYFAQIAHRFGLSGSPALIYESGEQTWGLSYPELLELTQDADLLINIGGHLTLEALKRRIPRKLYFDDDPGFTQLWHATNEVGWRLDGHHFHFYFTVGENIGTPDCPIPTGGTGWRRIRPPVVLEQWSAVAEEDRNRFTTVASWRGQYGPVRYGGKTLGLKVHELRKFLELPQHVRSTFEIALDIHPADDKDLTLLRRHGWQIVDPKVTVPDPDSYRRYLQTSAAEFSAAKSIYVQTFSGWFSDRTAHYLACGKLVQDTGFSRNYPVGEGLVAFRTLEEAVAGAERIARDYEKHSRAARALAEEYFDSDKVLGRLIDEVGIAP
jgi:hypothetical protein